MGVGMHVVGDRDGVLLRVVGPIQIVECLKLQLVSQVLQQIVDLLRVHLEGRVGLGVELFQHRPREPGLQLLGNFVEGHGLLP
jgi:hypothetical protein